MKSSNEQLIKNLVSKVSLVLFFSAFPFIFVFNELRPGFGNVTILCCLIFIITFFIKNVISINVSRHMMLLACISGLTYYTSNLTLESGVHLLIFACFGFPFILFSSKEYKSRYMYIGLLFVVLIFRINNIMPFFNEARMMQSPMIIYKLSIPIISILIIVSYYYFVKEIDKASEQLIEKNKRLESAYEKLKKSRESQHMLSEQAEYSKLVQGIAHEFKNPLQLMSGKIEYELTKEALDEGIKGNYIFIMKTINRLNNSIQPLLEYLNINKNNYTFSEVEVSNLVSDIIVLSASTCAVKKIDIKFIKKVESGQIIGDKHSLGQVLINLITNAIDAIGINGEIELSMDRDSFLDKNNKEVPCIRINVKDNGKGIEDKQIKNIFTPYFSGKKESNNVGLGLSIASKIIYDHNGTIEVESKYGKGTCFTVMVPTTDNKRHKNTLSKVIESKSQFKLSDSFFQT